MLGLASSRIRDDSASLRQTCIYTAPSVASQSLAISLGATQWLTTGPILPAAARPLPTLSLPIQDGGRSRSLGAGATPPPPRSLGTTFMFSREVRTEAPTEFIDVPLTPTAGGFTETVLRTGGRKTPNGRSGARPMPATATILFNERSMRRMRKLLHGRRGLAASAVGKGYGLSCPNTVARQRRALRRDLSGLALRNRQRDAGCVDDG